MKRTVTPTLVALALASILGFTAAARADPAEKGPLENAIDFKVTQADSGEVFKTFGQILGAEVTFDPALAGRKLSLQLENVRLRTALGAACDTLGCTWTYVEGKPARLAFKVDAARNAKGPESDKRPGLDQPIDIKVTQASVADVLRTAAEILSVDLNLDPKVSGNVDLDLNDVPVRLVLTRICGAVGCSWKLIEGDRPVLQVTSTK